MDNIDTSESTWKGKVIRYRKWEQRHDRTTNPDDRKTYAKVLAEFYVDLSNTARAIVQRVTFENGASWTDHRKPLRDETWTDCFGSHRYTLKRRDEEPNRIWFRRFEHEPWFDLGYWNDKEGCFQDVPVDKDLVMRNRALDIQRSAYMGRTDHIHVGPSQMFHAPLGSELQNMVKTKLLAAAYGGIDPIKSEGESKMYERPEDLEAAAAHAMARAAELRAIDDREPTGEEATVSWTWADEYEGAKTYTFVAFRSDEGVWYATGHRICRDGVKWRELALGKFGKALREGTFHIVTEWSAVGGDE